MVWMFVRPDLMVKSDPPPPPAVLEVGTSGRSLGHGGGSLVNGLVPFWRC